MSKKITIEGNYCIVTDTVDSSINYEAPKSKVRYVRFSDNYVLLYSDGSKPDKSPKNQFREDVFIDSGDTPIADIYDWLQNNTGAGGSTGGGTGEVVITQRVDSYSSFTSGTTEGELGYAENSEGTAWLPWSLGGTYYPAGWYVWSGAAWVSDRNAIANELHILMNKKEEDFAGTVVTANVSTTYSIDWDAYSVFKLTMTGDTTFSDSNLPTGANTRIITLWLTGSFTGTFPSYYTFRGDTYDGTKWNKTTIDCVVGTTSSEFVDVVLENTEL